MDNNNNGSWNMTTDSALDVSTAEYDENPEDSFYWSDYMLDYFKEVRLHKVHDSLKHFHTTYSPIFYTIGVVINLAFLLIIIRSKVRRQHYSSLYFIALTLTQTTVLLTSSLHRYTTVNWFCKFNTFMHSTSIQVHFYYVAATIIDRCFDMMSVYLQSAVGSTGQLFETGCCVKTTSAMIARIHKIAAWLCTSFGAKLITIMILIITFCDNTYIFFTFSSNLFYTYNYHDEGYTTFCTTHIFHFSNNYIWFTSISSILRLTVSLFTLTGAAFILYVRIKDRAVVGADLTQANVLCFRRSLSKLVLFLGFITLIHEIPFSVALIQTARDHLSGFNQWGSGVMLLLFFSISLFYEFSLVVFPVVCFMFLRPATTYEVRYLFGWAWYSLRYCHAGVVRDDKDNLVSLEESTSESNSAYESSDTPCGTVQDIT